MRGRIGRVGCVLVVLVKMAQKMLTTLQPKDATPHHLVLLADPQIIDPHSYPSRPWPLSALTVLITDNYLRRGYMAMQSGLRPDTLFFLGDLFDGGREWKTRQGHFEDPKLGRGRSKEEKGWVDTWHKWYGEDYWLTEYMRFGEIFFNGFQEGGDTAGAWQRGRKLVASLPGNHDLGFGAQVQVPVRDRFEAFFGDVNRVDVVGNHSIVSIDSVSLSADTSEYLKTNDLRPIYGPALQFLEDVKGLKKKAMDEELSLWYGTDRGLKHNHIVTEFDKTDLDQFPKPKTTYDEGELPTILLSHVPLYREPGTPCGPNREHWPPTKPPPGQAAPVKPDHRNAISVSMGYQYQNVLSDVDSANIVSKVGNVVHAFSGDDHDYCEVVHTPNKGGVREITVKSNNMAMGIPTPGFLMVSMWNPVDAAGRPIAGAAGEGKPTLQTHLCLLPNQIHTYMKYVSFIVVSLVLLAVRALLVPVLHLTPFALGPETPSTKKGGFLPRYKDKKMDPPDHPSYGGGHAGGGGTSATRFPSTAARARGNSVSNSNGGSQWQPASRRGDKRWGWGDGPRIRLDEEYYYPDAGRANGQGEKGVAGARRTVGVVGREMWTCTWRVAWMAVLFFVLLTRRG